MTNFNPTISIFKNLYGSKETPYNLKLLEVYNRIKIGYPDLISKINIIRQSQDKNQIKKTKESLLGIMFNGTLTAVDPAIIPAGNDRFTFFIGEGKYRIQIVKGVALTVLFEQAYTPDTYKRYLHGAVSILDATGTCDEFSFTPSGLQLATIDGIHEIADVSEITIPNYISNIGATPGPGSNGQLTLTLSPGLSKVLGYQVNSLKSRKTIDSFIGVKNLDLISFPNAILVELVNVPLNSYDAISRHRKNILGFLPGLEQTSDTSNYYYVASEMVFINTKLYSDTLINSWRVRLTDRDGKVISIDPGKIAINIVVVSK